MRTARYLLVDVFTGEAFGGNPLAVFVDGSEVPERLMHSMPEVLAMAMFDGPD